MEGLPRHGEGKDLYSDRKTQTGFNRLEIYSPSFEAAGLFFTSKTVILYGKFLSRDILPRSD